MRILFTVIYCAICLSLFLWVVYDVMNLFVKKITYRAVPAIIWHYEKVVSRDRTDGLSVTYKMTLKYEYDKQEHFYTTKWSANFLLPELNTKRTIYVNRTNPAKVYFVEPRHFIIFVIVRIAFLIPLIKFCPVFVV